MAQMGRAAVKNLEAPRPLKSTLKQTHVHVPVYEVQSIEELITLTENVAASLDNGCNNADGMNALLANLRLHGPQLELVSKDTLDRAFVIFRNASQDERLNIMTRLNLLELIELRAKSWQVSDGTNTYYKHKATNVEPDVIGDPSSLLSTSPPGMSLGGQQIIPSLSPGELIRTSGKFPKPTKIPGKTYCKDEIVIRNADSGKVMGIKGRRVHMIEELSETVISFQRVNPGAKERLVQITGPNEDKINYAKQLIEDTIRRNASPVRLETSQDGSCSSLASSASDDGMGPSSMPRRSVPDAASLGGAGNIVVQRNSMGNPNGPAGGFMPSPQGGPQSAAGLNLNLVNSNLYQQQQMAQQQQQQQQQQYTHPKLVRNGSQNNGQGAGMLLHSFSQNDASLGEYKYTVNVGRHSIKITGDCFDLVRVAKLVLDDYFSSNEFLASVEMGSSFDLPSSLASPVTPLATGQHPLITGSPFVDSGVGLDVMASGGQLVGGAGGSGNCIEIDDDVFIVDPPTLAGGSSSSSSNSTLVTSTPNSAVAAAGNNGLSRSRRSHFSRKDSAPEGIKDGSRDDSTPVRIVHEYERLIYYSKSPHSWALPRDWLKICDKLPYLVRNKVNSNNNNNSDNNHLPSTSPSGESIDPDSNNPSATNTNSTPTSNHNNNNNHQTHDANNNNNNNSYKDSNNDQYQNRRAQYYSKGFFTRHATTLAGSFDTSSSMTAGTGRVGHGAHRYPSVSSIDSIVPFQRLVRYKSTSD